MQYNRHTGETAKPIYRAKMIGLLTHVAFPVLICTHSIFFFEKMSLRNRITPSFKSQMGDDIHSRLLASLSRLSLRRILRQDSADE